MSSTARAALARMALGFAVVSLAILFGVLLAFLPKPVLITALLVAAIVWWLWWPRFVRQHHARARIVRSLARSSERSFQQAIIGLFVGIGYAFDGERGRSGSLHMLRFRDPEGRSRLVAVKISRSGRAVTRGEMRALITDPDVAERRIFVTSSSFSNGALGLAREAKVGLLDGRHVADALASSEEPDAIERMLTAHPHGALRGRDRVVFWMVMAGIFVVLILVSMFKGWRPPPGPGVGGS